MPIKSGFYHITHDSVYLAVKYLGFVALLYLIYC
jgi:hypothetical protein